MVSVSQFSDRGALGLLYRTADEMKAQVSDSSDSAVLRYSVAAVFFLAGNYVDACSPLLHRGVACES